jgi:hypothetical protein
VTVQALGLGSLLVSDIHDGFSGAVEAAEALFASNPSYDQVRVTRGRGVRHFARPNVTTHTGVRVMLLRAAMKAHARRTIRRATRPQASRAAVRSPRSYGV